MFDSCPDMLRVEDVCKLLLISRNSLYVLLNRRDSNQVGCGEFRWQALVEYVKQKSGLK